MNNYPLHLYTATHTNAPSNVLSETFKLLNTIHIRYTIIHSQYSRNLQLEI